MRLRRAGLSWRRTDDEIVVLNVDEGEYFALNGSGALLWEEMHDGDPSAGELAETLQRHFDLDQAQAHGDVAAFVEMLNSHGLIER